MPTWIRSLFAAAALLAAGLCLSAIRPQDSGPAPSPEVARLVAMTGLWKTETVFTGMPATTGLAKLSLMSGNWLIEEFKGEFNGKSFEGHGITGWDPAKQRYVNAWVDSADTQLRVVDLTWDESQQALVADAQRIELGAGQTPTQVRGVTRIPDPDTLVFTLTPVAPDALPIMTITYTRDR